MARWLKIVSRLLAVTLPLAAGVAAIALTMAAKSPPEPKVVQESTRVVRVITLEETTLVPRVVGYGTVMPSKEWRAVARVEGEVSWTSSKLANGEVLAAEAKLMRIDDSDINLTLSQVDAQLHALDVKDQTTYANIQLAEETLVLARTELKRINELERQSVASKANVEQAERQEISSRTAVLVLENQLELNAAERDVLSAQRAIAARALTHTSIDAPYAIRIGDVQAEVGQFVSRGQTLFSADGVDAVEISAQFPLGRLAPLVSGWSAQKANPGPLGLDARVRLHAVGRVIEWPARVDRIGEMVDPRTQSASVVVTVEQPLALVKPGDRPPLRRNMFVEVELSAAERQALIIPAGAVRNDRIMVVDDKGRLQWRDVDIAFTVATIAVVVSGLTAGDQLIVSDLSAPVNGMSVTPIEDDALKSRLAAIAQNRE